MHAQYIFLSLLPLLGATQAVAHPPFAAAHPYQVNPISHLSGRALFSRQTDEGCPIGQKECDGNWCGAVCCNLGNGNSCPAGSRCVPGGCCPIGESCSGAATCTSRSNPLCSLRDDCCSEDLPYCVRDTLGNAVCASKPGTVGDSSDDEETPASTTTTKSSSFTVSIPTKAITSVGSAVTSVVGDAFDTLTSKAADVLDAVATSGSKSDLKDILKDAGKDLLSGDEEKSAGVTRSVGMGVAAGLGMAVGAAVMLF